MLIKLTRIVQEKLGLTKSEAGTILFLSFGLLLGGTAKILNLDKPTAKYDFKSSDSFFSSASAKIDSIIAADEDTTRPARRAGKKTSLSPSSPIDINKASAEELILLPGVGKVTAGRIVDYRKTVGKFKSIDDLLNVKGIGQAKFAKLKPYVRVL